MWSSVAPSGSRLAALVLAGILAGNITAVPALAKDLIFKVASIGSLSLDGLVEELKDVRVVVVGEQHDNRLHHEIQLSIISRLHESDRKLAVGFEMFGANSQRELDLWVAGKMTEDDFFKVYLRNWDLNWYPLYRDIFVYCREHGIPMVGLNVPREVVRQVAQKGFSSLSRKQREKLGFLSCDVDERYQRTLAQVLGAKGHAGGTVFGRFCEAQVVWDTSMALRVIEYGRENPDTAMVVLAGTIHAWKRGIVEQISRRADLASRVILPSSDSSFFDYEIALDDADYVWWLE